MLVPFRPVFVSPALKQQVLVIKAAGSAASMVYCTVRGMLLVQSAAAKTNRYFKGISQRLSCRQLAVSRLLSPSMPLQLLLLAVQPATSVNDAANKPTFQASDWDVLRSRVDAVTVMTYDAPSWGTTHFNAPIIWFRDNIEALAAKTEHGWVGLSHNLPACHLPYASFHHNACQHVCPEP